MFLPSGNIYDEGQTDADTTCFDLSRENITVPGKSAITQDLWVQWKAKQFEVTLDSTTYMPAGSSELGLVSGGGSKNYTFDAIFGKTIGEALTGGTFARHFGAEYPPTKTGYNFSTWVNLDPHPDFWFAEFNEGT